MNTIRSNKFCASIVSDATDINLKIIYVKIFFWKQLSSFNKEVLLVEIGALFLFMIYIYHLIKAWNTLYVNVLIENYLMIKCKTIPKKQKKEVIIQNVWIIWRKW